MDNLNLAERIESYDPATCPDNRAVELELHRDIVMATGAGTMNPSFEMTFLRSIDAAMTLAREGAVEYVLCAAMLQCGLKTGGVSTRDLPRFIAAAALRAGGANA